MLRFNQIALFLVPACLGLIVSLWYQLKVFDTRILFVFDSAHYLLTSSQLLPILQSFCQGNFAALAALRSPDFVSNIMLDGPVLPLLGALSFFLSGQQAAATSWLVLASVLSAINGFSAGALAILSSRLFSSKFFCLAIGLFFALSPATIISSGRFLTEPISTFLLLLLCLTCLHLVSLQPSRASFLWAFAAGLLAATGFLTKAALAPGWFGLLLLGFYCRKRTNQAVTTSILASVCGAFVVLSAWGVFSLVSSGQLTLMPQRMPAFNLATGNNIEIDGRATMPVAASTERYVDKGSSLAVLLGAWSEHPSQLANLYLRKIPRVMGFVWNDFKQVVFLDLSAQNFIHGVVLSLAAIGLFLMIIELAASSGEISASRQYLLLSTIALIAIHTLFYLPFEAIVRYASPVQPFIVLAGAYGLISLCTFGLRARFMGLLILGLVFILKFDVNYAGLLSMPLGDALALLAGLRVLALCSVYGYLLWLVEGAKSACRPRPGLIALLTFLFVFLIVAPVLATTLFQDDQRECRLELKPAQRLVRDLIVPASASASSSADYYALYIDCDARGLDAQFLFNGVPLSSKPVSVNKIDSSHYFLFDIMRMYASVFDIPTEQMRQWRVVEIPAKLLAGAAGKKLQLAVVAGATGLTIYGDRLSKDERQIRLPDRGFFCANRFSNDGAALESRILAPALTAVDPSAAQILDSEQRSLFLPLCQPRVYLLKALAGPEYSTVPDAQSCRLQLATKQFDRVLAASGSLASGSDDVLKIDRYTFQLAHSMGATIGLPDEFAQSKQAEICLEGQICSVGRANKAGVFLVVHGSKLQSAPRTLAASPPFIACQKGWTKFEIRDHVFLPKYLNDQAAVTVSLFPGRWEQFSQYGADRTVGSFLVKDLVLSVKSLPNADLAKRKIEIY